MSDAVDELLDNVQVGVNDVDSAPVLDDDAEGHVPFEIEAEPVFNQLADKMYEDDSAAIREGLTNAVTAVKRAIARGYIDEGEGTIELRYYEGSTSDDNGILVLRDNGIGMSWTEVQEVVSKIGATTARDEGDLAGQFGMGFLALFKLVGLDGGFIMHTNSRLTDNDPYSGLWRSRGFKRDMEEKLDNPFADDEYGVQFEFPLKDGVSAEDVEAWVRTVKWARIPVVYERYGSDGSQKYNDELGGRPLRTELDANTPFAEYEDEYVHAITAPNLSPETVLLDVPIRRNDPWNVWQEAPFGGDVLVRLKNEKGVVVDGPHEGLLTAKPAEYEGMTDDRKEQFAPRDALTDDDVVMPWPVGNRDSLASRRDFWEWLADKLATDYKRRLRTLVADIDTFEDVLALDAREFTMFKRRLPPAPDTEADDEDDEGGELPHYDPPAYADAYEETTGIEIDEPFAARLNLCQLDVHRVHPNCADATSASNHTRTPLGEVLYEARGNGRDGDLFMGVTMNHARAEVVWADTDHNEVIAVEGTDWYPVLDELFDIRKLKRVTKSRLDEFDISDEQKEAFLESPSKSSESATQQSVTEKTLTAHFGRDGRKQHTYSRNIDVGDLAENCEQAAAEGPDAEIPWAYRPDRVVAFPRGGDYTLGDYKLWLSSKRVAAVSVTTAEWEYLDGTPRIVHIDDYIDAARDVTFPTSDGDHTVASALDAGNFVIHLLPEETLPLFRDDAVMAEVATVLKEERWSASSYSWGVQRYIDMDAPLVYAPMARDTFSRIRPLLNADDIFVVANEATYRYGDPGQSVSTPSDAVLYAAARLDEWQDTPELRLVEQGFKAASVGLAESDAVSLIDTLTMLHDSGVAPASQQDE